MNRIFKLLLLSLVALCATSVFAATKYVITNDDSASNSATIYSIGAGGALTQVAQISTGGTGIGGGYFATGRVDVLRSKTQNCAYIGDALGPNAARPGDVYAIDMATLKGVGAFPGFPIDAGALYGVGLAESNNGWLFAAYTQSASLTTYKQEPGCKLKLASEVITVGASGGGVDGMKVTPNGKFLIIGYSDGSIGSYSINSTTGALTLVGRWLVTDGGLAGGVDITADSKWAIFGDASASPSVEVAPIKSNGVLGATVGYTGIGSGSNSNNVLLSPDETLLYIDNNSSGQLTAVPFNKTTGAVNVSKACTSPVLTNFGSTWFYIAGSSTGSTTGTGSPVYSAEWGGGNSSGIGIVNVKKTSSGCSLSEAKSSPASDPNSTGLLTVGVDPPRPF